MHIPRHFTQADDPYAGLNFVPRTSKINNPDGTTVFKAENVMTPDSVVPGGPRHPRPEIFPPRRRCRAPSRRSKKRASPNGSGAPCPTKKPSPSCPKTSASSARPTPARSSTASPAAGPTGAGRAATSPPRPTPAATTRNVLHARHPARRPQLPPVVQHRPPLGLRHLRPRPGPPLR